MKSVTIGDTIVLENETVGGPFTLPCITRDDCEPGTIYLLPHGSRSFNAVTGETIELLPGYYVNPKQLGMIKDLDVK